VQLPRTVPDLLTLPRLACALLCLCLLAGLAPGQTDQVRLELNNADIGLSGFVRPGQWNPLRMRLRNLSAEPRQVRCQWIVPDIDGDPVYYERRATLSPQREQAVWVYAALPITTNPGSEWRVQVLDDESEQLLAAQSVSPNRDFLLDTESRAIGITGGDTMGLAPYTTPWTQHEAAALVRDLYPPELPDRWYGYSSLRTLVWTPQGGDPTSADMAPQTLRALREWVRRGGHLVVVLPAIGDTWTSSALAPILPDVRMTTLTGVDVPTFLGSPVAQEKAPIDVKLLRPARDSNAAVLLRDRLDQPLCVAHAVGAGRVTLLGVDLTDSRLRRMRLPNGKTLWRTIFTWQGEAFTKPYIESLKQSGDIAPLTFRAADVLDTFLSTRISMRATTSTALLLALLLFGAYWLVAGPGVFAVLKKRGLVRHAWLAFVIAIAAFSAIAWGGAVLLRPTTTGLEHFSVIDARAESPQVRTLSWATLFVPDHGQVRIQLAPELEQDNHNTISNTGLERDERGSFLGRQSYPVDVGSPHTITPPMRATAKGLQLQYMGDLDRDRRFVTGEWLMPAGSFRRGDEGFPVGRVSHGLPQPIENLLVVFDLGDGRAPMVWRHLDPWAPGDVLEINKAAMIPPRQNISNQQQQPRRMVQRLWVPPVGSGDDRQWAGHLADLIRDRPGAVQQFAQGGQQNITDDRVIRLVELLTFYEALPTPHWWRTGMGDRPVTLRRRFMRAIDRSEQLPLNRIHLIGYMPGASLPAPLAVDGRTPPSKGWVVLRWSAPLPPPN